MSKLELFGVLILGILLVALILLLTGALLAFLWNAVLVGALHLSIPTIDLWVGVGLALLGSVVGGLFRR